MMTTPWGNFYLKPLVLDSMYVLRVCVLIVMIVILLSYCVSRW